MGEGILTFLNPIMNAKTVIDWIGLPVYILGIGLLGYKISYAYGSFAGKSNAVKMFVSRYIFLFFYMTYGVPAFHWFYKNFWKNDAVYSIAHTMSNAGECIINNWSNIQFISFIIIYVLFGLGFLFRITLVIRGLHIMDEHESQMIPDGEEPGFFGKDLYKSQWTAVILARENGKIIKEHDHFGKRCIKYTDLPKLQ